MTSEIHLGHVHLKVDALEEAVEFYRDLLDAEIVERQGRFVFLTLGNHHHDLALQEVPGDGRPSSRAVGLYHVAFECPDAESLRECYEHLRERGVQVSPVDHRISKALYFDDPAGNGVELYIDTRAELDDEQWGGENRRFDPMEL